MVNLLLILAVCIPTALILAGLSILYIRFRKMDDRLQKMDRDVRQFYHDLGRTKAEIISFRGRSRPS